MFQEIRLSLIWKSWITVGMGKSSKANYRLLTSLADSTFYRFTILCKPFCHHSNNRMSFIFSFLYQVLVKPRASNASVIKYQRNLFSFDSSVKSLALLNQDLHSKKIVEFVSSFHCCPHNLDGFYFFQVTLNESRAMTFDEILAGQPSAIGYTRYSHHYPGGRQLYPR